MLGDKPLPADIFSLFSRIRFPEKWKRSSEKDPLKTESDLDRSSVASSGSSGDCEFSDPPTEDPEKMAPARF